MPIGAESGPKAETLIQAMFEDVQYNT